MDLPNPQTGVSPLDESHFEQLKNGLAHADEALRRIALAERANIDMTTLKDQVKRDRDQILRLLQVYFPGR